MSYNPFMFDSTTKLYFGDRTFEQMVDIIQSYHFNKLAIVCGSLNTVVKEIITLLKEHNLEHIVINGVTPNPRDTFVNESAQVVIDNGVDLLVGIGGGSVIDSTKAIAIKASNPGLDSIWELTNYSLTINNNKIKIGLIVTNAATGSDSNASFVISNDQSVDKLIFTHESVQPLFAINNPVLTLTLPEFQTACGIADIMSHLLEKYLHNQKGVELSDNLLLALMKSVVDAGRRVMFDPQDLSARSNLMLASSLAMNKLVGVGHESNWVSHFIEHAISAKYDIAHGAGMAMILPHYIDEFKKFDELDKLHQLNDVVFNDKANKKTSHLLREFFNELKLPSKVSDLVDVELNDETIEFLADKSLPYGDFKFETMPDFSREHVIEILKKVL